MYILQFLNIYIVNNCVSHLVYYIRYIGYVFVIQIYIKYIDNKSFSMYL